MERYIGKILLTFGVWFICFGYIFYKGIRLPGDIFIKKENFVFYFPIVSSIIISIILTLILSLLWRR